jgi:HlyD family secretion protein
MHLKSLSHMKSSKTIAITTIAFLGLVACTENAHDFDASGTFEAEEFIISSEATGIIKELKIEEGQELSLGATVGYVDTTQLYLKRKQLQAQYQALLSKKPNVAVQLAALESQLKTQISEKERITKLVAGDAAPKKQLDDINASIDVIKSQIRAQQSSLKITIDGMSNDAYPLTVQIEQITDQLNKSTIRNPIVGTVLAQYARQFEMTSVGKPLYKIADLSSMILRVYITNDQLALVKLNQKVTVQTDDGTGGLKEAEGVITWINDKAEFTPKTIQTKDERANMVYAMKVNVKNDGQYKIGMYGQIKFK